MDFQLKQWREDQSKQEEQQHSHSAKLPSFSLEYYNNNDNNIQHKSEQQESTLSLPLFTPDQPTKISIGNMSVAYLPDSTAVTATKYPRMGSYFSFAQWQELELQALIYRHMLAGSPIPPELLHLIKKSLLASSPYYLPNNIQHYPYFHQSILLQSGYWGRAAMDPEPGRCRRTDGKKWRCSRDIVPGHKYCERHVHRGRNRSRKPVEIPTPSAVSPGGIAGGGLEKESVTVAMTAVASRVMAHSRSSEPTISLNYPFETQSGDYPNDGKSSARILRPFFDDWPKSLQESDNVESNISSVTSTANLSISTSGNPSSDFSLKLSTGSNNVEDTDNLSHSTEREQLQSQWNVPPWGTNQVASMGGPLAEALRSSTNSSPTSVLFQLPGGTRSHPSFVSS
ncbi:hypothetical protein LIER_04419 [Lithospermum erythrorhizon]|uniref:Growth-regulating factor n=1 Tax=Lithospermum erythrorhizon TaxID=34254 RepID=A0AAV3NZF2_LITER